MDKLPLLKRSCKANIWLYMSLGKKIAPIKVCKVDVDHANGDRLHLRAVSGYWQVDSVK